MLFFYSSNAGSLPGLWVSEGVPPLWRRRSDWICTGSILRLCFSTKHCCFLYWGLRFISAAEEAAVSPPPQPTRSSQRKRLPFHSQICTLLVDCVLITGTVGKGWGWGFSLKDATGHWTVDCHNSLDVLYRTTAKLLFFPLPSLVEAHFVWKISTKCFSFKHMSILPNAIIQI